MLDMPGINLRLNILPLCQKLRVAGGEMAKQVSKFVPEFRASNAGSRQSAVVHKIKQLLRDLDTILADIIGHGISSSMIRHFSMLKASISADLQIVRGGITAGYDVVHPFCKWQN